MVIILVVAVAGAVLALVQPQGCGRAAPSRAGAAATPGPGPQKPRGLGTLLAPNVLVEKSARRLTVFDGRSAVKSYRVIVGLAGGDKVREGDRRTPEGRFYVCMKNPTSKFVLSLGLSYPNEEDAARGLRDGLITRAQHDGIVAALADGGWPDWYTPLGGEIMIHGCAGGRDGTAGCVAMQDDDIRELFAALPLGTPVEIRP